MLICLTLATVLQYFYCIIVLSYNLLSFSAPFLNYFQKSEHWTSHTETAHSSLAFSKNKRTWDSGLTLRPSLLGGTETDGRG